MLIAIAVIFVLAYAAIALEHPLRINKSATALIGAGLLWAIYAATIGDHAMVGRQIDESVASTAQIVFFLIGAMTIVEVIDAHDGFEVITSRISTTSQVRLMWLIGFVTFFLSAILDNLTTTIVMVSLIQRLIARRDDRLLFASLIVIAANAGGAWTVIGDVTTTMLWIGGQITPLKIMGSVFLPSLVNLLVPLAFISLLVKGKSIAPPSKDDGVQLVGSYERNLMFYLGLGVLIAVPAFKAVTHLPPFMGVLLGLGIVWLVGEVVHRDKDEHVRRPLTLAHALTRIDMSSIVFFLGILLAVACLEHAGLLSMLARWLEATIGRQDVIVVVLGLLSAVIDNVPLVAATMGMYDLGRYPPDSFLWEFIAYCAGTGGSILIIGSAAGVAAMGLERIEFLWYARRIAIPALAGYLAGAVVYVAQHAALH
ncbi:sodium:proton antiporter NhaD [Bradyrhizobium japonicum]|uniref:sodium:proton antiporter NhaD n=1 Tax=Bradyrhizobium japonicum TaxID=375 RepID=UPI00209F9BA8|nr:sodium:proton antiporter NhaD [Bradyrhizobium japonicum]MCP1767119.1 Na+/H+ antiporter NhaD/arsenite permease-like protein [Bradyrhizobium japonicum]MCP1789258.1 Na+/H+ antiporter NhaD/arsenite permease-like protein [Bradyrhizobium japonicum]MCP1801757.1 Na+/H+ antiporter NhaD/arsenite permease-like protein [Bradyrhizobium japonicum]MCP1820066.1 Na+/H+ antiporter NhaD/arsenite permease-like protein [Bradyrhizobium japonicum]MCP1868424.1 Na+/H+ antiporter NhaD/arsenite permease-like protein 